MHKWVFTLHKTMRSTKNIRVCVGVCRRRSDSDPSASWLCFCPAAGGEEKEDGASAGAEELFGTTSESDTSTFHGFEEDELEEPATNSNGISNRHR